MGLLLLFPGLASLANSTDCFHGRPLEINS